MTHVLVVADHVLTGFSPDGAPEILADAALLIEGETIAAIGPADPLRRAHPHAREIGGRGRVAMPGLVNAHHHVGLTPFQLGARDLPLELWFPERLAMRDIETVMVGGAVVYHEGRFTRVDRDATLAEIASALDRADTPAESARRRLAADLIAPVRDFYRDWLRGA